MSRASTVSLRLAESRRFSRQSDNLAAVLLFVMTGLVVHWLSAIASIGILLP